MLWGVEHDLPAKRLRHRLKKSGTIERLEYPTASFPCEQPGDCALIVMETREAANKLVASLDNHSLHDSQMSARRSVLFCFVLFCLKLLFPCNALRTHTCMHACMQAYIHTDMHACMLTRHPKLCIKQCYFVLCKRMLKYFDTYSCRLHAALAAAPVLLSHAVVTAAKHSNFIILCLLCCSERTWCCRRLLRVVRVASLSEICPLK